MKCTSCDKLSFYIICKTCQKQLLAPNFYKKELVKDFFVYSFYDYKDLEDLIQSKYHFYGDRVFNILGKLSFAKFASNFTFTHPILAIPIDDHTRHDFSQTAILAKHLKSSFIKPVFNTLKATNIVKYAGKNLEFRQKNPRKFTYSGVKNCDVILVDDVITTGTTILEAKKILKKQGINVLFAITLCCFLS
ncbi:DNA utilization protein GntX [Aliarcobacter thereius]|uniref:DNA utilization protein GntX n=1 Tax=Aliarcobacter thereius LMG 24486 TaxID=1032240 RepID=A0A1C7WMR7_9BACT|nr:phosphoribosyltransferase family protein [Aliarcobacter thereius]OCL88817.1 DNA utilization protein GntX [Aliarcobacter thereius]OCL92312.1 DNA utilization protein GntX [Aliarcobacter thereius]OCL94593.1 DNA utilization protein GntX [Aliarcobacter thereius LMG 24486]QBF15529.1 transformation system, predicted amidophosphoribosyltransferase CtsW [Aliarcobacter thereius LMG 24486]TLS91754.1 ComF family protein [Aliarcobacter thereius]